MIFSKESLDPESFSNRFRAGKSYVDTIFTGKECSQKETQCNECLNTGCCF